MRDALLSLIQENGFRALSVQDIINRANVGRATFYAHFDNKEDLLLSGLEGLRASLKALQRRAHAREGGMEERFFGFSSELFAHTNEHRAIFRAMVADGSAALVREAFHRVSVELIQGDVAAMASPGRPDAARERAVVQFLAGGLYGMLMWWLEGANRPSPEEASGLFRRLAVPVLAASQRPRGERAAADRSVRGS